MNNQGKQTHFRACNICEAICGLEVTLEKGQIISIKGDKKDPLSKGHICPKAVALQDIYNDPDRLRQPLKKTKTGWQQIPWKQAFDEVASQLKKTQQKYGNNSVAIYQGNPTVHNLEAMLFAPLFTRSLKTKNKYSATSVDQLPEQVVSLLMFGHGLLIPLPDLDRSDFVLIFGANPVVSNGSLMTAPGVKKRLIKIQQRGGQFVVVDPRKTETAQIADQHLFIKPGTDALMLLAMLNVIFDEKLSRLGRLSEFTKDLSKIEHNVKGYTPEKTAAITGVDAEQLKKLIRDFCQAKSATCYGRIGVSTHEFGTLTQWLIVVLNVVTGNLDCVGGAMFSQPAFDILKSKNRKASKNKSKLESDKNQVITHKTRGFADYFSRVRKLPSFQGELPVSTLADEILTEGDGQIKALVVNAGNPVLSTPNGNQLDRALTQLDFMVSIDMYVNETSRQADIILPPPCILERPHYDIVFHTLAIQNTARFSAAIFKPDKHSKTDTDIFLELAWRMQTTNIVNKISGWMKKTIIKFLGCEWVVNHQLKRGYYAKSHGLNLKMLKKNSHGIDLGAMQVCLPKRLFTKDKMINLAPQQCLDDLTRLNNQLLNSKAKNNVAEEDDSIVFDLLLIGRRDPRTNNSWLHNSYRMVKGKNRCVAFIHPTDAQQRSISDGETVMVKSRVGEIKLPISITSEIMQGVVSIPHGWGHEMEGVELNIAKQYAGVNTNILTDDKFIDQLSGNSALNGVAISVAKYNLSADIK